MDKHKNSLQFSYGNTEYIISIGPFLIMGIAIPLISINIILLLFKIDVDSLTINYLGRLIVQIISLIMVLILCPVIVNQHNKIHVTKNGLKIRVFELFFYRWIEVPWEEILGVDISNRKDRWRKTLWVIKVKKLTLWHRFLSTVFYTGKHPVILVSSDMINRETLLDLIKEHSNFR